MLDTTNCIGCRKGIRNLHLIKGEIHHIDLFMSKMSAGSYLCGNNRQIKNLVQELEPRVILGEELDEYLKQQSYWWEDIIELAHETFLEQSLVNDFFIKNIKESDEVLEKLLLVEAEKKKVEIEEGYYTDLLLYKK